MANRINSIAKQPAFWIVLAATVIGAIDAWQAIHDPIFGTDAGYRVFFAERPVVRIGNRVWLPFLQVQIWLYYTLGLPVSGLKLITVAYSSLGLCCLGLYWRNILGSGRRSLLLALLAVACCAAQPLLRQGRQLMQEPVAFGLLFLFAWLAARDRPVPWIALPVGIAAMLTRDPFWIYLFAVSLVELRNLPWRGRWLRFLGGLWAAPLLWLAVCIPALYLIAYRRFPDFPLEWPLMYNEASYIPSKLDTISSLWRALTGSRGIYLGLGVAIATAALLSWRRPSAWKIPDAGRFAHTVLRAAPIALLISYGLIVAFDPWQETPGDRRQAWPLIDLCLLAAPLLIRAADEAPKLIRIVVPVSVIAGLLALIGAPSRSQRPLSNAAITAELGKLGSLLETAGNGEPVSVCLQAETRWIVFTELNWPTFYHRQTYLLPSDTPPEHCRILVIQEGAAAAPAAFVERTRLWTGRYRFIVYGQ